MLHSHFDAAKEQKIYPHVRLHLPKTFSPCVKSNFTHNFALALIGAQTLADFDIRPRQAAEVHLMLGTAIDNVLWKLWCWNP